MWDMRSGISGFLLSDAPSDLDAAYGIVVGALLGIATWAAIVALIRLLERDLAHPFLSQA